MLPPAGDREFGQLTSKSFDLAGGCAFGEINRRVSRKGNAIRDGGKILFRTFRFGHREHTNARQHQILCPVNIGGLCRDDEVSVIDARFAVVFWRRPECLTAWNPLLEPTLIDLSI